MFVTRESLVKKIELPTLMEDLSSRTILSCSSLYGEEEA